MPTKTTAKSPSVLGDLMRHHPAILQARRALNGALGRLADHEAAAATQRESVKHAEQRHKEYGEQTQWNDRHRKRESAVTIDMLRQFVPWAENLVSEADLAVTRARRALADAREVAGAAPVPDASALDWRINPALIAAQRKADALETKLAEVADGPARAAEDLQRAQAAVREAEGAFLAGRGSQAEYDQAVTNAENARKHVVRVEAIARFAREDHQAAVQGLEAAREQAIQAAFVALNLSFGAAVQELAEALTVAEAANARLDGLYRSAARQFPSFRGIEDVPSAAGLPAGLVWPELLSGSLQLRSKLWAWRRQAAAAGYEIGG